MTAITALEEPDPEPAGVPSGAAARVEVSNPNRYPEAKEKRLKAWLEEVVRDLAAERSGTLAVRFVSDREMTRLNRDFRGKDRTTDVLSFPGGERVEWDHLGDVAVSVPVARRQARERGHSVERELEVLLVHGLLHCLGHDHATDDGEMAALERNLRRKWVRSDE